MSRTKNENCKDIANRFSSSYIFYFIINDYFFSFKFDANKFYSLIPSLNQTAPSLFTQGASNCPHVRVSTTHDRLIINDTFTSLHLYGWKFLLLSRIMSDNGRLISSLIDLFLQLYVSCERFSLIKATPHTYTCQHLVINNKMRAAN